MSKTVAADPSLNLTINTAEEKSSARRDGAVNPCLWTRSENRASSIARVAALAAIGFLTFVGASTAGWGAAAVCPASPNYTPDFSQNGVCMIVNGNAVLVQVANSTVLQITNSTGNQTGSAWYSGIQAVENGFTTSFQFQFTNPSTPPADGITFVIQNNGLAAIGYTGGNGGALGYGDPDSNLNPSQGSGIPNSLAIEFDTFENPWDPTAINNSVSHVAIQSCGAGPNTSHHGYLCGGPDSNTPNSTLGAPVVVPNMADGAVHSVMITYTAACPTCNPATPANIQVSLDGVSLYPNGVAVDLSSIGLGNGGTAYVGFTGATGGDWETQNILNWTFAPTQQGQQLNPGSPQNLNQSFVSNNAPGQHEEMDFDYTVSFNDNDLTVQSGTTPFVATQGINPLDWATIVNGTSMADAPCLLSAGQNTCAINTLTCTTSSNPNASGSNCPQSTVRNVLFNQEIDLNQNQPGIVVNNGTPYLQIPAGYAPGFAMAPDVLVTGSECSYPSGDPLASEPCPQNIITQLLDGSPKPGGTGKTVNSTYVFFCCEPEWVTAATIALWNNSTSVAASFTSNPPPTPNPDTNNFHAAQGQSVVMGAEPAGTLLDTTYPLPAEQTLSNPIPCPALGVPPATPWSTQNPQQFSVNGTITTYDNNGTAVPLTEGSYAAHYFSVDCDNFEELTYPASINVSPGPPASNVATFKTVPFNIDLTNPTITVNPASPVATYGTPLSVSVTCTDPVSNGVESGIASCAGVNPGGYPATATESVGLSTSAAGPQNYNATAIDQAGNQTTVAINYNVQPVALTITASSSSMNYGSAVPGITASYSGFVNGDSPASLTTPPTCTTTATSTSPVGSYPTTCTGAVDTNYTISYVGGTVTVNPAPATIALSNLTQTYSGSPLSPTVTTTPPGVAYSLSGAPDTNAGSYGVTATITDTNYTGSPAAGTFTISPAPATISLSNMTQTYTGGALSPTVTTSPTGLAYTLTGAPDMNVGGYPVTATITNSNYTLAATSGTFTISPAPATISLSNMTQTYTGGALSPTVTTSPTGLAYTLTGAPDTNAGGYPVTATITNTNYTLAATSGTFTISPAAATVTLGNLSQPFTGSPLSPTVTTSPSGLAFSLTGAPDTNVGSYPVTATVTNPNYKGSASGTFTITGAVAKVSPTSINFGTVRVGTIVSQNVTLTNTGNVTMTITSIKTSSGSDSDEFKSSNKCGGSLLAGANCVITVSYVSDRDDGTGVNGSLLITDSAPGSPQSVSLTGKTTR